MQSSLKNSSLLPEYPKSTAVVCHDAGAGNIVIANLLETGRKDWRVFMHGPAEKLWKEAFPDVELYDTLDSTLYGSEILISGTGWGSNIEHDARKLAHTKGIHSVALIDHWVNYPDRFIREGETVWPDEFWVTDDYALDIAKDAFKNQNIFQVPNYYFEKQLHDIALIDRASIPELLYVLEPARSKWGRDMQGEFQALDYFVSYLLKLDLPSNIVIRLRPHPSEAAEKYDEWVAKHSTLNIEMDKSISITQSLGRATWVAGCESFALVLALNAGCKVYCTLPPWAPTCRLPHQGLLHLAKLDQE